VEELLVSIISLLQVEVAALAVVMVVVRAALAAACLRMAVRV